MIDEKVLSGALQDLADRDEAGPPPLAELLRRGRRARAGRIARTAAVSAVAVAAVLVAGVAVRARPAPAGPVPLALAAQTTEGTTFHFRVEFALVVRGEVADIPFVPWDGKYDPVHDRGYLRFPGVGEARQIGSKCYVINRPENRWKRSSHCWRIARSGTGSEIPDPANPGDLLAQLRKAGQVSYAGRTGEGANAVDTYRFSFPITQQTGTKHYVVDKNGTVDIDVANHRITRVVYLLDNNPEKTPGLPPQFMRVVMRFDDFGTPVDVEEPRT